MFDVVEGLKILNRGRLKKFSIEIEEYYGGARVEVNKRGSTKRYGFIIPRGAIDGGGDEMMFMMHIHKALDEFDADFDYSRFPLSYVAPVFNFDGA